MVCKSTKKVPTPLRYGTKIHGEHGGQEEQVKQEGHVEHEETLTSYVPIRKPQIANRFTFPKNKNPTLKLYHNILSIFAFAKGILLYYEKSDIEIGSAGL